MRVLWISGTALVLDQASKWLVMETMAPGESLPVLGSIFKLTYVQNPGAVFGLRLGSPVVHLLFTVAATALVLGLMWRMSGTERLATVGLALVLGGAVGNAVDRVRFGAVVDFLDFGIGTLRWWVFNVADACVSTGTGLLVVFYGFRKREEEGADGD